MLLLLKPHVTLPYSDNSAEYSLGISTTINAIDQKMNVINLVPGLKTVVSVTPQLIETSEGFDDLDVFSRSCKLPHETYGLQLNKNYSRTICEHECSFMKATSICKCIPWFFRNESTSVPICDMFGGHCFNKVMSTREFYKVCSKDCLEDCNGLQLSWEKSFRPINIDKICRKGSVLHKYLSQTAKQHFSNDHYKRLITGDKNQFVYLDNIMRQGKISDHYETLCKEFVAKYVAIVSVESPTDVITLISRDLSVTFMEKIGVLGGELGLFTGFSIVTILDILTIIYNKVWPNNKEDENKEEKKKDKKIIEKEIHYGKKMIAYWQEKRSTLQEKMIIQQEEEINQLKEQLNQQDEKINQQFKILGKRMKNIESVSKHLQVNL